MFRVIKIYYLYGINLKSNTGVGFHVILYFEYRRLEEKRYFKQTKYKEDGGSDPASINIEQIYRIDYIDRTDIE